MIVDVSVCSSVCLFVYQVEDSKTVLLANSAAIVAAIGVSIKISRNMFKPSTIQSCSQHSLVTTDDIGTACCKLESVEVEEELEDLKVSLRIGKLIQAQSFTLRSINCQLVHLGCCCWHAQLSKFKC